MPDLRALLWHAEVEERGAPGMQAKEDRPVIVWWVKFCEVSRLCRMSAFVLFSCFNYLLNISQMVTATIYFSFEGGWLSDQKKVIRPLAEGYQKKIRGLSSVPFSLFY
jgi:hypothetical protein